MGRTGPPESTRGEQVLARPEVLANDGWVAGPELLHEMMAAIPPGEAQRAAMARVKDPDAWKVHDLIASGKRTRAVRRISQFLDRGVWVSDPGKLTREHWAGHARWKVKALYPGAIGMPEAAEEIGVSLSVLDDWIGKGLAPDGFRPPGAAPKAVRLVTPDLVDIYRRIAALRPPPNGREWKADPRAVWITPAGGGVNEVECPNCASKFVVELTVKPALEPKGWLPPGGAAERISLPEPDPQPDSQPALQSVPDPMSEPIPEAVSDPVLQPVPEPVGRQEGSDVTTTLEQFAMRSGRPLDEGLVRRMEDAVRQARTARASLVDDGFASHG